MTEQVGRYEIFGEIGQGGFATVYRARDTELDRWVALKELKPILLQDTGWVQRFRREARAIARLDHPRIVTVYDVAEIAQRLFIVMRLVDGPSLEELIVRQGLLSWPEAVEIISALAEGLDYAHSHGVLHRDLKPANILIDPGRGPQLTDFGLAKLTGEHSLSLSASGSVVGTPHYIAPEVWEGHGATAQADIYALGCILYEMITGEKIFKGQTPPAVMMAHFKPLELPSAWPAGVPSDVSKILKIALATQPVQRYVTAASLAGVLLTLTNDSEAAAPLDSVTAPPVPEITPTADAVDAGTATAEGSTADVELARSEQAEPAPAKVELPVSNELSPSGSNSAGRLKRPRSRRRRSGCAWLSGLLIVGVVLLVGLGLGGLCSTLGGLFTVGGLFKALPTVEVGPTQVENIFVPLPAGTEPTNLELKFDSGNLTVSPGAKVGLLEGIATYNVAQLEPHVITSSQMVRLEHETTLGLANVTTQNVENSWELKLGQSPLELDIEAAFVMGRFELGGLPLHHLSLNPSAGEIELRFSSPNPVEMDTLTFKSHAAEATLAGLANARPRQISLSGTAGEYTLDFTGELHNDIEVVVETTTLSQVTIVVPEGMAARLHVRGQGATITTEGSWQKSGNEYLTPGERFQVTIVIDIGGGTLNLRNP